MMKTRQKTNRILAFILVGTIAAIGLSTLIMHGGDLAYAALVTYTRYLDGSKTGPEALVDNAKARISSVNSAINVNITGKDWFQKQNARFQTLLGKQILNFGSTTMVKLKTGQLYDLLSDVDVTADIARMARIKEILDDKGIPMVFVYAHGSLYEDDLLPEGVEDDNCLVADKIVNGLRDAGIDTIDSREVLKGEKLDDIIFATDQHWTPYAAFKVYLAAAEEIKKVSRIDIAEEALDEDNYDIELFEKAHMGDVGARLGSDFIEPDDFTLITPRFKRTIHQKISRSGGGFTEREGSFKEAVLNMDVFEENMGKGNIYDTYGYHTELVYYTDPDAAEGKLLIVKDSFGTPVSSLMSLAVSDICALDLRKGRRTIEQMVEEYEPDAVLIVHCQEMMRGKNYVFVD